MQIKSLQIIFVLLVFVYGCDNSESGKKLNEYYAEINYNPEYDIRLELFQIEFGHPIYLKNDKINFNVYFHYFFKVYQPEMTIEFKPYNQFEKSDLRFNSDSLCNSNGLTHFMGVRTVGGCESKVYYYTEGGKFELDEMVSSQIGITCIYIIDKNSVDSLKQKIYNFAKSGYYDFESDKFKIKCTLDSSRVFKP